MAAGRPDADALVAEFREALGAMGTPRFPEFLEAALAEANQAKIDAYVIAYVDGVGAALVVSGIVGIGGALLAWFLTGRRDPLRTVFDLQDERGRSAGRSRAAEPSAVRSRRARSPWAEPRPVRGRGPPSTALSKNSRARSRMIDASGSATIAPMIPPTANPDRDQDEHRRAGEGDRSCPRTWARGSIPRY